MSLANMVKRLWQNKLARAGVIAALLVVFAPYILSRLMSLNSRVEIRTNGLQNEAAIDAAKSGVPENRLRIVSYNIAHARGLAESNWQSDASAVRSQLEKIATVLRELDADVVLLNEVDFDCSWSKHVNQAEYLARKAGYSHWVEQRNLDFRVLGWTWKFGNVILSRYPISDPDFIDLPEYATWEDVLVGSKNGVSCKVTVGDASIRIVNAHLSPRDEAIRVGSVEVISGLIEDSELPVIAGGDFNSAPRDYPAWQETASGKNAIDQLDSIKGMQRIPSANRAEFFTFPADAPARIIDWIFFPAKWSVQESIVKATELSDHRPVLAELQWRAP